MTLDELQGVLTDAGVTPVYLGQMPDTPDTACALLEYGGRAPSYTFGTRGIDTEYPRLQVLCRGEANDYLAARELAETAYATLAAVANESIDSTHYQAVTPLQPPFLLKRDERDRVYVAFNVEVAKAVSA